jgi:hypothetical protein
MLKSIHSPLTRFAILGFIVFGSIVGSTKISSSGSSPSPPPWVPSNHPFQSGQSVHHERVFKGTKSSTGGRQIDITSILRDENLANKGKKLFIIYTLRDKNGVVKYVGKASGEGIPSQVMTGRISSGHDAIKNHSDLVEARIELLQNTEAANQAAEDILFAYYKMKGLHLYNKTLHILSENPKRIQHPDDPRSQADHPKPYPSPTGRNGTVAQKIEAFHQEMKAPLPPPFAAPSSSNAEVSSTGSLPQLLSGTGRRGAAKSALGGIDFSTLELRYLAEDSGLFADRGLRYAFNGTPAIGNKNLKAGRIAAAQASDAFFVWLELSPDKFWVNLNPNEPDRIIDPALGATDVGRVLLESDFLMKKTRAKLTNPDTPLGRQHMHQILKIAKIGSKSCPLIMRNWIVPAPATVREDGNGIHIVDAPLDVKLEALNIKLKPSDLPEGFSGSCSVLDRSTMAKYEALERRLILPHIVQAVNTAPEYAELRRVYRSRVAAEWYRQRSATKATAYRSLINKGDVSSWPAPKNWLPKKVFNQYVTSFRKVEYHVADTRTWQEGNMIYTQKILYVYPTGGVDFTKVLFKKLNSIDFQEKWGDLQQVVDKSMKSPVTDRQNKVWLGGSTTLPNGAIWKSIWFYFGLGVLMVPLVIYWKRQHGKRWLLSSPTSLTFSAVGGKIIDITIAFTIVASCGALAIHFALSFTKANEPQPIPSLPDPKILEPRMISPPDVPEMKVYTLKPSISH